MTYNQYSQFALTGLDSSVKNRIDNNQLAANSEYTRYPEKFDVFVNKENTSLGGFSVVEEHTPAQLQGSKLYLDHRLLTDISGNYGSITTTDGIINLSQTDLFDNSIQFSTVPVDDLFYITYVAAGDKVQDSHINALQNTVMSIESTLGIKSPINNQGTGLITLPILINVNPGSLAEATALTNLLPNAVLLHAINEDIVIGGTQVPGVAGYGTDNISIYLGNPSADTRNNVYIDANRFVVSTTNGSTEGGTYIIGTNTGDSVYMSGMLRVKSQTTIGFSGGAGGIVNETVPTGASGFYNNAMLRVHGGIWFGSGMSGNGNITFITTTGQSVTVSGPLNATTLNVDQSATFNGPSIFNKIVDIRSQGYLQTNNDILMLNKSPNVPTKIDGFDPSYGKAITNYVGSERVVHSVRKLINETDSSPNSQLMKVHPTLGLKMYPIIGGWTFPATVFLESVDLGANSHRNIILLQTSLTGIGDHYPAGASTSYSLGRGQNPYGVYCTGLFNPGDTYIEIQNANATDHYSYPIYYHTPFFSGGIVTGLNVYVAADDLSLQTSIAGKTARLFQPTNVPLQHLKPDGGSSFLASNNPVVRYGNQNNADYSQAVVGGFTKKPDLGNLNVVNYNSLYKEVGAGNYVAVNILSALQKSIEYNAAISTPYAPAATGIAYVYVVGDNSASTQETSLQLRASPYSFAPIAGSLQMGNPKSIPGQELPVGEIVCSTTDGTTWTHVESVSYRPDGFYDSCWVPMVQYRSSLSTLTTIPANLGRCLPIYGTAEGTEYASSDDNERYQFYVEHNIGPVRNMSDVDVKIWVAAYAQLTGHPLANNVGNNSIYKAASAHRNLWTPYAQSYNTTHNFYQAHTQGTRGFLTDMTSKVKVKMFDSRFAMISMSNTEAEFEGDGDVYAQYIRVVIRKRT